MTKGDFILERILGFRVWVSYSEDDSVEELNLKLPWWMPGWMQERFADRLERDIREHPEEWV